MTGMQFGRSRFSLWDDEYAPQSVFASDLISRPDGRCSGSVTYDVRYEQPVRSTSCCRSNVIAINPPLASSVPCIDTRIRCKGLHDRLDVPRTVTCNGDFVNAELSVIVSAKGTSCRGLREPLPQPRAPAVRPAAGRKCQKNGLPFSSHSLRPGSYCRA